MIPDDVIDRYLKNMFGDSEPGTTMHHMLIAALNPGDASPLGAIEPKVTIYAIAPDSTVDADQFVALTIGAAIAEAYQNKTVIHFAALAMEVNAVAFDGNEVTENRARRLRADRKLAEHSDAVEVTMLYAACRDGRRWVGEHILTGPRAGAITGPNLRVGPLGRGEFLLQYRLIRAAVGLEPVGPLLLQLKSSDR